MYYLFGRILAGISVFCGWNQSSVSSTDGLVSLISFFFFFFLHLVTLDSSSSWNKRERHISSSSKHGSVLFSVKKDLKLLL